MSHEILPRRICFVTGTRAEFGLMRSTLLAVTHHPGLNLQIIATGMHLDPGCGRSIRQIRAEGWSIDATVPWKPAPDSTGTAVAMGKATAGLARAFQKLSSDIVLVVGDRVEAFAAAAAGQVGRRIVAHVHGGDRALGQVDDALRHAITKLAHVHFPATATSADRLRQLGEDQWRIHCVGSPGVDGLREHAASNLEIQQHFPGLAKGAYALLLLHPTTTDPTREAAQAMMVYRAVVAVGVPQVIIVGPNNDPGARSITAAWRGVVAEPGVRLAMDLPRNLFLGLMRDAGVLVGNSSSGIIEAASFGTPVLDIGDRQLGRERGENVTNVPFKAGDIRRSLAAIWNAGKPRRFPEKNLYGNGRSGQRIASVLARISLDGRLARKLIAY